MSTVRWGILGAGAVAGQFAAGLASVKGARLEAVSSRSRAAAEAFASRFGAARTHHGYEELVQDPDVDVVYVATLNEHHKEHCLLAIRAGKAVLCEKPFALDAAEGRAIVEEARRKRVFCMEAMWMRFSPALREALSLARAGALGELRLLSAQLGFTNDPDSGSRLFTRPGGGALLDLGVYPLSLAHAIFGRPSRIASHVVIGPTGVDEQVTALLEYPGSRQAIVAASLRSHLGNSATIHGTDGLLELGEPLYFPLRYRLVPTPRARGMQRAARRPVERLRHNPLARSLAALRTRLGTPGAVVRRPPGNGYDCEAAEVVRCLGAGLLESPGMPLDETLAVLETMDAIRRTWTAEG